MTTSSVFFCVVVVRAGRRQQTKDARLRLAAGAGRDGQCNQRPPNWTIRGKWKVEWWWCRFRLARRTHAGTAGERPAPKKWASSMAVDRFENFRTSARTNRDDNKMDGYCAIASSFFFVFFGLKFSIVVVGSGFVRWSYIFHGSMKCLYACVDAKSCFRL